MRGQSSFNDIEKKDEGNAQPPTQPSSRIQIEVKFLYTHTHIHICMRTSTCVNVICVVHM